jgi:excisionase family DNA binding protein
MAWHSVKEAAPLVGLSVDAVYVLIESRRLGHRRVGTQKGRGKIQISDEHIAAFHRSCEVPVVMEATPKTRQSPRPKPRADSEPLKYF